MIILKDEDFVGKGNERACYIHPEDKNKAIKITYENNNRKESKQTKLEVNYYKELEKRRMTNFKHLPKYFGEVKTDKGAGFVVELIRDFDGEVSKTFEYYLKKMVF